MVRIRDFGNVLQRQRGDDHWIDTFVLVDLVRLLLSAFVRPDETLDLPAFAVDPLHAIYQTAATELSRGPGARCGASSSCCRWSRRAWS